MKTHQAEGAVVYGKRCAVCHGDRLEGIGAAFPSLVGVANRMSDTQISGLIYRGKGRMPPLPSMPANEMRTLMEFLGGGDARPSSITLPLAEMNRVRFTGNHKFHDPEGYLPWPRRGAR